MPSQTDLRFTFQPLVGRSEFEVVSFELDEAISTPFQLQLELISFEDDVDFGQLLDKPVLFTIWRGERPLRYVHGLVSTFSQGETGFHRTRYRALVEPVLARAGLRSNWRIFQQKTVPQILQIMLERQGITGYTLKSIDKHEVREFCVQAGETDLDFIARLAAEEGFVYRFEHTPKGHTLIITDRLLALGQISRGAIQADDDDGGFFEPDDIDPNQVLYHATSGGNQPRPCLRRLRYSEQVRTARQVQRDYTFTHPAYRLEQRAQGNDLTHQSTAYERFDYPGRYKREAVGVPFTATRITALRHDARMAEVEGDDVRLQPGLSFTLIEHPREDLNLHWRVNRVHHEGVQFTSLQEEAAAARQGTRYKQDAVLVPGRTEWRPAPLPRPRIDGPHMATVVGPKGEEIYCDQWGRVKVSFPWDRESQNNEFSSCWVRVSQGWAGGSWGSMAIPRIGQDVIIQYVNGDPDQPMITGRTYCGDQLPPYDLPEHKTRMTIKSQTHKGDGYNELRFEDELGKEEVFIHAQRDQNNIVKHDETTQVGNDRTERVERDETISIGQDRLEDVARNETVSIGQNRTHEVGNDDSLSIGRTHTITTGKDRIEHVGNHRQDLTKANHTVEIGGHLEQVVAGHSTLQTGEAIRHTTKVYDIQVSESLTIRSPAGLLRIDGAGITLDGLALDFKGPISQQAKGSQRMTATAGVPEPGEPICLSCLLKAIADGHNMIPMEGAS
ncbi:type VI secretion system Vgr family protein [Pseudomonas sp. FYR_2]|uniref:Type VI secretion system tip protein VgrG n=5 Tax=Pseudomonas TaxID=286 RepID=A0A6G6UJD2_9PSED|nr:MULTISPECIES: type VI secretion system tip protein TssI/VgrG [Pseudomonas]MBA6137139.1 type VI secretion system tip protein VgrG [Pseudomonas monteilii]MBV4518121.1 type VI secretion system tip protein VgrG [Pseudomonas kurunegalensis]MCE0910572.1 type VI secretion system tip protein VgrG [Pseudomonas kurunegalensis]MDT3746792.1 type VI secretion system tip protein TssI/VgrG [Pseudomonas kurunegalensis]MVF48648.1 type VI secretion system tip protein VgrG [Pseudomonas monteilii]